MHSKDGFHCCYNVQTAVDSGSHLIAEYEVTNHNTDQGLLQEVTASAKKQLKVETISAVADKGYESRDDILNCIYDGTAPTMALKYDKEERSYELPYEEAEITEEEQCSAKRGRCIVYKDKEVCRECKNKCTNGEYKEVSFGPETDCVPVKMFGILTEPVQQIPPNARISPSNHTLDTGHVPKRKVVLRIKDDKEKLKQRMCLSEHPFGTVKWYRGAHYLLCRGKTKAAAELGLSFLAYNMTRAISMVGVRKLIEAM